MRNFSINYQLFVTVTRIKFYFFLIFMLIPHFRTYNVSTYYVHKQEAL